MPPPGTGPARKLRDGPLFDLAALQAAIRSGALSEAQVLVVNRSCASKLEQLDWGFRQVLDCLQCALATDFKGAEWCETSEGRLLPCDAYAVPFNETTCRRERHALEFYLKFSVSEDAVLNLLLVRVHL